ncbi:MAG: hypothetical protein KC561_21590, partial [Myxococcales bacterium]|nr:hypothetical protein [Myxococcales bacterium]
MDTRANAASETEPHIKPKQLVKRAGELLREARTLLKKKGKKVDGGARDEVSLRADATEALLPTRKNDVELQPKPLYEAVVALD